jgi:uncharacterized protein (TIGR02996 family)
MSERDGFLRAIVASPRDDLPRLVYADWLEERGEGDHAAFIRVQCALARCEAGDERDWLEAVERRLLRKSDHRRSWAPAPVRDRATSWEFERGFASRIEIGAASYLEFGEELRAAAPIRHVELGQIEREHLVALASSRWLDGLELLDLEDTEPIGEPFDDLTGADPLIESLVARFTSAGIKEFGLMGRMIFPILSAWERRLVPLPRFTIGRRFRAMSSTFQDIGCRDFAGGLRRARVLALPTRRYFGAPLCDGLSGLESLILENAWGSEGWSPMRSVEYQPIGGYAVRPLRELAIRRGRLVAGELQKILETPRLRTLSRLELSGLLVEGGWPELFQGTGHSALRSLSVSCAGFAAMSAGLPGGVWERFPNLAHLAIEDADFDRGDDILAALAGSGLAPRLRKLSLRGMHVTDRGIGILRRAGVLERLHVLGLEHCRLDDAAIEGLIAAGPWPALSLLDLGGADLGKSAADRLREEFGSLVELGPEARTPGR